MHRKTHLAAVAATLAAAALPAAAHGHVTLQPEQAPAGGFERLDVRVPNERDRANTTKVEVKFPPGFIFISREPVPGWAGKVKMAKLDEPVEAFGEEHSEQVDTVTFSTKGKGIAPGEFQDFGLSVGMPEKPTTLTFKSLQTYDNGEVVRWIGAPDSDEPAPQVELTAAEEEAAAQPAAQTASSEQADDDGSDTLAVVALIVGALGFLAGVAALLAARRVRTA
jgi:uncharacterized protein YcnI